jgi:hypothetical protein
MDPMPARRSTTPLFDLISHREQGRTLRPSIGARQAVERNGHEAVRPEPAPRRAEPPQAQRPEPAPASQTRPSGQSWVSMRAAAGLLRQGRHVSLSPTLLVLGFAGVCVAGVVLWTVGFSLGRSSGRSELLPMLSEAAAGAGAVQDPLAAQLRVNPGLIEPAPPATSAAPRNAAPAPPASGAIMVAGGSTGADPRQPRTNYLALSELDASEARRAIEYFASRGVRLVGIPVAPGSDAAANRGRFRLYSLGLAVPSAEYSAMRAGREQHQAEVARLGSVWQREHGGTSNFSQTYWERFGG